MCSELIKECGQIILDKDHGKAKMLIKAMKKGMISITLQMKLSYICPWIFTFYPLFYVLVCHLICLFDRQSLLF